MTLWATPLKGEGVLEVDFDRHPEGVYSKSLLEADWHPSRSRGVNEGRVWVVGGLEALRGKCLAVTYLKGLIGPDGGAQFMVKIPGHDDLSLEYQVKFQKDFDFVKGGKLPGLCGGACNTGGRKPAGEGFSARYMWRAGGKLVLYLYHMDQPTLYGEDFPLGVTAKAGTWYCLKERLSMNTPGKSDGRVRVWIDGKKALDLDKVRFRSDNAVTVDAFYFDTFFGGSSDDWAAVKDERAYFDKFRIFVDQGTTK
jgi:hypothetical protein